MQEDTRKLLRFKFNQPIWDYIDYFVNPNGEYLVKAVYNKDTLGNIQSLTNGLEIGQGDNSNNNEFSLSTTNPEGNVSLNLGKYGILNVPP